MIFLKNPIYLRMNITHSIRKKVILLFAGFLYNYSSGLWRGGRVAEGARLESV